MALEISAADTDLLLKGWFEDRVRLKALFYSPGMRCCATVFGLLHRSVDGNLFVHPSATPDAAAQDSALVFQLDDVQRYDFAAADVVENSIGLVPGQLARVHGETMLTITFTHGCSISLSNLPDGV